VAAVRRNGDARVVPTDVPISDDLRRVRLEFRARKLEAVLGALQRRARVHRQGEALCHTIAAFEHELTSVHDDLRTCGTGHDLAAVLRRGGGC
jgi:hypothetical protein